MAWADLNDRNAVLEAIAEFELVGREAFLAKYGFGHANRYILIHEGKEYDAKAIIWSCARLSVS
jgi:5-methylcytosine-specific restriction protein A